MNFTGQPTNQPTTSALSKVNCLHFYHFISSEADIKEMQRSHLPCRTRGKQDQRPSMSSLQSLELSCRLSTCSENTPTQQLNTRSIAETKWLHQSRSHNNLLPAEPSRYAICRGHSVATQCRSSLCNNTGNCLDYRHIVSSTITTFIDRNSCIFSSTHGHQARTAGVLGCRFNCMLCFTSRHLSDISHCFI